MIFVEYYIEKYENFLKFTFHGFAAHLKDFVSERFIRKVQSLEIISCHNHQFNSQRWHNFIVSKKSPKALLVASIFTNLWSFF